MRYPRRSLGAPLLMLPPALGAAEADGKAARLAELPIDSGSLVNTAIGLVLVLALIVGLAWVLRRFGGLPSIGKGVVSILGGVSLGPRERAVLLQVGRTRLLVGVAPGQVRALHVLSEDEWEDAGEDDADRFGQRLEAVMKERRP
ncbi:MAG TPA: flagellar biosynthetic protein FliO [Sedimenticola sp.]|nr:flagellar biosynthetic protein FliO [Sedimenticola sp.]